MSLPKISIIVPCRNEEKFISECLNSLLNQDYPKNKIEILVMNGMSTDSTSKILKKYQKKYPMIKEIKNKNMYTPFAINLGIKKSTGSVIFWTGAHTKYKKNHISKCIHYMKKYNAEIAGGTLKATSKSKNIIAKSIAICFSNKFGVGNSEHKTGIRKPKFSDSAFGPGFKKSVFKKIGLINEGLTRGQDMELFIRAKKAGIKTLLIPEIESKYYPKTNFLDFIKYNFKNGLWVIMPFKFSKQIPVRIRHLIPLAFVSFILLFLLLSTLSSIFIITLVSVLILYLILNFFFSLKVAIKEGNPAYLITMPIIFSSLHISYGLGSLFGILKLIFTR